MSLDRGENWRRYERACKAACERMGRVYDAAIATRALMVDNDYPEEAAERMPLVSPECTDFESVKPCRCDYHTAQRELVAAQAGEVVVYGTDGTPWTVEDILRREA